MDNRPLTTALERDKTRHSTRVRARAAKDSASSAAATEAQILLVMADPAMLNKSVAEKAAKAGVSRATWYRHLGDPLFRARARAACTGSLQEHLGPVLHALAESALLIGRSGHPDRKLFLELVGFTAPVAEEELAGAAKPGAVMSDQELLDAFTGREHLLPAGVLRRLGRDPDAELDAKPTPRN